jgi:hypothetical protein
MKGSKGYVEIELGKSVEVHHFDYYHFNQTELSDSKPKIITVEAIRNTNTLLNLGTFNAFGNVTQRTEHGFVCPATNSCRNISSKTTYTTKTWKSNLYNSMSLSTFC